MNILNVKVCVFSELKIRMRKLYAQIRRYWKLEICVFRWRKNEFTQQPKFTSILLIPHSPVITYSYHQGELDCTHGSCIKIVDRGGLSQLGGPETLRFNAVYNYRFQYSDNFFPLVILPRAIFVYLFMISSWPQ